MSALLAKGIIFPISEFLKYMSSSAIEGFLGFNLISGIVTGMILLIVIRALVQSIGVGRVGAKMVQRIDRDKKSGDKNG